MRTIIVATLLASSVPAGACPIVDRSYAAPGGRVLEERCERGQVERYCHVTSAVPPRPSVYLHVGSSSPWLPTFTRADGTPVRFTLSSTGLDEHSLRADLEVDDGIVAIRYPRQDGTDQTLVIDPTQRPHTRIERDVSYLTYKLDIETNAAVFVVESTEGRGDLSEISRMNDGIGPPFRVTALYADGTAEEVFALDVADASPPEQDRPSWPAFVVAILALWFAGFATRMSILVTSRR